MLASCVNEQHVRTTVTGNGWKAQEGLIEHTVRISFTDNNMLEENPVEDTRKAREAVLSYGLRLLLAQFLDVIHISFAP